MANLRTNNLSGEQGQNAYRGSVFFDGEHSYLALGSGVISPFGTNDFTIEFWINQGVNASNYTILINLHTTDAKGFEVAMHSSTIHIYTDTGTWRDTGYAPKAGVYEHIAFVRNYSGNTLKMYANGEEKYSVSNNLDYNSTNTYVNIGSYDISSYGYFQGYLSNVRITDGTALYTTNYFTPPTSELTADANTVLLCCQDSNNPTKEETGKTITANGGLLQTASELTAGELTSSNYSSAASDWSFSGGTATVSMSSNGYASLGSVPSRLRNGELYELVVNVTTFNAGKITFGQANAGNADFTIALGRNVIRHVYAGSTQNTGGIAIYARDATGGGYAINLLSLKQVIHGDQPKVIPPSGVDAGNTFGGPIQQSSQGYMYFPTGRTEERGRGRAVAWLGANNPSGSYTKQIDFFDIQSTGTTTKFGEISDTVGLGAAMSSSTRGVFAGGSKPGAGGGNQNLLEFITIATTGNAVDFGGVSTLFRYGGGISNQTRGLIAGAYQGGGASGTLNTIQFITIATLGNTADFGDIIANSNNGIFGAGTCSSSTRGITFGGGTGPSQVNEINSITIGTLGNSVDFGDLSAARYYLQGLSSSTRGVVAGGQNPSSSTTDTIEFITIASTGDATDFGNLVTSSQFAGSSGGSNKIRGVFIGGGAHPTYYNAMEFITIATTGNASDFGDFSTSAGTPYGSVAVSDSHGGLS